MSRRQGVFDRLAAGGSSRVSATAFQPRTSSLPSTTSSHQHHYGNNTVVSTSTQNNNNNSNSTISKTKQQQQQIGINNNHNNILKTATANNNNNNINNTVVPTSVLRNQSASPSARNNNYYNNNNTTNSTNYSRANLNSASPYGPSGGSNLLIPNNNNNKPPPASTAMNNNNTTSSSLPFSHTIGRVQDRQKLGIIERENNYGHSPLNHNIDYSSPSRNSNQNNNDSPYSVNQCNNNNNNGTSPISGYQQRSPSRGLFSPNTTTQQQQQNGTNNPTDISGVSNTSSTSNASTFVMPGGSSNHNDKNGTSPSITSNRASPVSNSNPSLLLSMMNPDKLSSGNGNGNNNINNNTGLSPLNSPMSNIPPPPPSSPFHPPHPSQYRPAHPPHQRTHLLPKLDSVHKHMEHQAKISSKLTALLSSPTTSGANNNNNGSKGFRSPSMDDLSNELASKGYKNGGATAGAFGQPVSIHNNNMNMNSNSSSSSPTNHGAVTLGSDTIFHHTIVFDLDETLCSNRGPTKAILRPGAIELLRDLAQVRNQLKQQHEQLLTHQQQHVESSNNNNNINVPKINPNIRSLEIVLWTASMEDVAEPVIQRLDPYGDIFDHLIFRDNRWFRNEANYTKDLRLLGRDFGGIVIVENSPVSVRLNRQNSILVKDFVGHCYRDNDLFAVKDVLMSWIHGNDKCFIPIEKHLKNHNLMCPKSNTVKPPNNVGTGGIVARW